MPTLYRDTLRNRQVEIAGSPPNLGSRYTSDMLDSVFYRMVPIFNSKPEVLRMKLDSVKGDLIIQVKIDVASLELRTGILSTTRQSKRPHKIVTFYAGHRSSLCKAQKKI